MKALIVVAQEGYQPVEYADTKEELEKEGVMTDTASIEKGEAVASDGSRTEAGISIKDAGAEDYDAVVVIGGPGAKEQLICNEDLMNLLKEADNAHKIIAAICISPLALAQAGLLKERNATVWNEDGKQEGMIRAAGAHYTGDDVTIDTRIVTANGPAAAERFGKELSRLIKEGHD